MSERPAGCDAHLAKAAAPDGAMRPSLGTFRASCRLRTVARNILDATDRPLSGHARRRWANAAPPPSGYAPHRYAAYRVTARHAPGLLPSRGGRLVRPHFYCAHPGAGRGVAGDPPRRAHPGSRTDRLGQDADSVPGGDRRAGDRRHRTRRRPAGADPGGLRVAAEGAVQRHPHQPGGAAGGHRPGTGSRRLPAGDDPYRGAHRRYATGRARTDAQAAAADPGDHARIAVHPARLRIRPRDAQDHPHGDRGRDPRGGRLQARLAPGAHAGAAAGVVPATAAAYRPVGDTEADRQGGPVPGRQRHRAT